MQSIINSKINRKGAQGIGTLIIFIAMILVAAVAAGVLIQTASSLQSKSLDVGRQSQDKITTDIEIVQVYTNSTTDGQINNGTDQVTMIARLGSGSSPIKLTDLLVRLDTQSGTQSITYSGDTTFSITNYGVDYKISGSGHVDDYLSVGDLAEISFIIGGGIAAPILEGETATLRLITKNGAVKPVQITTPSAMTSAITYLYP